MATTNIKELDVDFTLKDVPFEKTPEIIQRFIDENKVKTYPSPESLSGGIHAIFVDGYWADCAYATFVLNYNSNRFYIRIRKPIIGVPLEDCIQHRDAFADKFIDYLIANHFDIL